MPNIATGPQQNTDRAVERVRRYYALVDQGDVEGLLALFADEAVYARPGYPPLHGKPAIRAFYRDDRVIASGRHGLREVVVTGGRVAVHGDFAGTLHDGRRVALRFADFFSLDAEARFTRRDTFFFTPLV